MFEYLQSPPVDALHSIAQKHRADPRPQKLDLGVGVYRDENGHSKVLQSIRAVELEHVKKQTSKAYVGLRGEPAFIEAMENLVWGRQAEENIASIQAVGGTGAISLALTLAKRSNSGASVLVGCPTWPNHITIAQQLGLNVKTYDYFCKENQTLLLDNLRNAITGAKRGDVLILHGPCHNPSGEDMPVDTFIDMLSLCQKQGVVPLIDTAYYGLGNDLAEDMALIREAFQACDELFVAMSCSKAFSLYRERVGILFVKSANSKVADRVQASLEFLGRTSYSMPPSHGAIAVSKLLSTPRRKQEWETELGQMRERIKEVRLELSNSGDQHSCLRSIRYQKGIFSLLPISGSTISRLAEEHAIYMPTNGRINIAGFKTGDPSYFIQALANCVG